ncbi:MAG TPA: tryptophan synthase subunit alpha [Burkholderiales bacterium]|nr:tryptophan synthase subunit alpha [Burkholderiales bacterium]
MSRIAETFKRLRADGRKGLIPFITAGDPEPEMTLPLMHALAHSGADVIELGVPFSDPMADGPTIQRSSERALKHGIGLDAILELVKTFRRQDATTPVVLMGYANPIEAMGYSRFAKGASEAGVDGVLVVDYPPEEADPLVRELDGRNIDSIFLLSPTSSENRIEEVAKRARGYLYYVSLKGVTGAGHLDLAEVEKKLPAIRKRTDLPIGVGFGIREAAQARAIATIADAVVIGSRLVEEIESSPPERMLENVKTWLKTIRNILDEQRT